MRLTKNFPGPKLADKERNQVGFSIFFTLNRQKNPFWSKMSNLYQKGNFLTLWGHGFFSKPSFFGFSSQFKYSRWNNLRMHLSSNRRPASQLQCTRTHRRRLANFVGKKDRKYDPSMESIPPTGHRNQVCMESIIQIKINRPRVIIVDRSIPLINSSSRLFFFEGVSSNFFCLPRPPRTRGRMSCTFRTPGCKSDGQGDRT